MDKVKVIEIKEIIIENNDLIAKELKKETDKTGTLVVNIMSSPGSGKTTFLTRTINSLKDKYKIAVLEADIDGDVDAYKIQALGVDAIQLHTGGECHLTANMVREGIAGFLDRKYDIIFLENIGNLVCPAEFDVGADVNIELLSVPEGDDKPLKYPLMFKVSDYVIVSKYDTLSYFDFDLNLFTERVKNIKKDIDVIPVSALDGFNFDRWLNILENELKNKKKADKID